MDVESLAKQLILQNMTPEQQSAVLESVRATLQEARGNQKRRVSENVGMVVDALKKIEADIRAKYDDLGQKITDRVNSIQDGRDGIDGSDGRDGKDGRPGRDGATGAMGPAGRDGRDGVDGKDGVSVIDAKIDFDGSLIISLSNGREINVGEVVAADVAEKIRVLTYGGNSGGGGGTSGLTYKGTWNASTNTPTLVTSSGTNGDYYIVSVAGTTDLNGITDWSVGDWVIFNGTAWQKIDQSWATAGANDNITSMTGVTGGVSSPDFVQFDTGATVTNAAGRLYWDATQQTLTVGLNANIAADIGQTLYAYVTNDEAVTINKGQPVYMYSAQGDRVSVKLAYNTSDATSAKTLGVCAENIAAGQAGLVLCQGVQDGLDLSAYNPGDTLYLGATAGTLTATKPYAPNHLVYIGVVERANAGNGRLYVRVQNGYEMDELHNVSAQNPTNGQVLIYNESTSLWTKNTLTDGTGISITEGAGSITIANSAPDQTVALTAGTGISTSGTYPNFTITNSGVTSITGTTNEIDVSSSTGAVTLSLPATISADITGNAGTVTNGAYVNVANTFSTNQIISTSSTSDALRITQTGAGNALVVEDSTNPDATPFVVNATGNVGIGTTSPTNLLSVAGNADITGNTTLGDASTDTVTVNGYMGVGIAPNSTIGFRSEHTALTGATQVGGQFVPTGTSAATSSVRGVFARADTAAASFTTTNGAGFWAGDSTKGAGSTITNQHGLYVADQTQGTNNFGITSLVSSGTNKWNIYASGTAANYFAGNVGIGTATIGSPLTVVGAAGYVATLDGATDTRLDFKNSGTRNGVIQSTSSVFQLTTPTAIPLVFLTNNNERMRIDSAGNVGIGTSSPAQKLDIAASNTGLTSTTANNTLRFTDTDTTTGTDQPLGKIEWYSADATTSARVGAYILATSQGTSGGGNIEFGTSTDTGTVTEQMQITGSGDLNFNSGYGSVATAYGCRAWVNFDGTTNVGGFCTIRASGNVSSVADNGTGNYTVNFTNAMPDVNYATCANAGPAPATGNYSLATYYFGGTYSTSAVQIATYRQVSGAPTATDYSIVSVAIFR